MKINKGYNMIKTKMLTAFVAASAILYGATSTESNVTEWSPDYYSNNIDVSQELCIPGTEMLTVTINGETEAGYDWIYVGDDRFSGPLSEEFDVSGPCVTARFTSDYSVIRGEGPTVKIEEKIVDEITWTPEYKEESTYAKKELCVEGAYGLDVKITGETEENHDRITIRGLHDTMGTTFNKSFSGPLNVWARTTGSCVEVLFTTDRSTKVGDGPTVTVSKVFSASMVWEPEYTNNADESIEMCHFDSNHLLSLEIAGETEGTNDVLTVNEKYAFSGIQNNNVLNSEIGYIEPTRCVKLRFQTNGSVIQGKGFQAILDFLDS